MAEEKIIEKLIQHDQEFVAVRQELKEGFDKINETLERVVTILRMA